MAPAQRLEVTRYQGDLQNPDNATAQTIALMCQQIEKASQDPLLQRAAKDAVRRFRGGPLYAAAGVNPASNPCAIAESAWWWVKHALKFQLHNSLIQVWFNERDQLQLLISPDLLLRMSKPRGDCAIYSMLVCAMLRAWGIPYELVTSAVTPNDPEFDHVWARAILPDGRRLNLDASHGKYPGWQVPFEHRNRTQVWDLGGNPVEDAAPRSRGLHAYQARPNKPILPKRLAIVSNRGMGLYRRRGLGQDETTLGTGIDTSNVPITNPPSGYNPVVIPPSTPSPFASALAQSLPGLLAAWTNIGGKVLAPSVQYTGPGGVSYSAPASSGAASALPLSIGTIGTTSYLPILLIGGGLIALMIFAGKK